PLGLLCVHRRRRQRRRLVLHLWSQFSRPGQNSVRLRQTDAVRSFAFGTDPGAPGNSDSPYARRGASTCITTDIRTRKARHSVSLREAAATPETIEGLTTKHS